MTDNTNTASTTDELRRTVLKAAAATGVLASVGGTAATAQDDEENDEDEPIPIVLGGKTEYWLGLAPEPIEGEENPTLQLEADQEYEIVWINLDGEPHELELLDEDEEQLEAADELVEPVGEVQRHEFTATEEVAAYRCTVHPTTMVADVEIGDGFDEELDDDDDADDEETDDEDVDEEDDDY